MKALKINYKHSFLLAGIGVDLMPSLPTSYTTTKWNSLQGKIITNKNVILERYGDIHPFQNHPIFECETLFLNSCDKNFIAYWLHPNIFPNVKQIFLSSHPCDSDTPLKKFNKVYLHEKYSGYKKRWWPSDDNVEIITDVDYITELNKYNESEPILFKK